MSISKFEQEPSALSTEIVEAVRRGMTTERDSIGLDPWAMRQFKPAKISLTDLQEQMLLKAITSLDRNPTIPKMVHFIWVGSYFTNLVFRKVLEEWARNNPDYKIYLWYHALIKNEVKGEELAAWAEKHGILLMDVENTLIGNMHIIETSQGNIPMDTIYANEIVRRQFAGASDVLRLIIVHYFGGLYSDIDNRCVRRCLVKQNTV